MYWQRAGPAPALSFLSQRLRHNYWNNQLACHLATLALQKKQRPPAFRVWSLLTVSRVPVAAVDIL